LFLSDFCSSQFDHRIKILIILNRWIAPIFVNSSALDELIVDDGSVNAEDEIKAKLLAKIAATPEIYPAHFHDGYHTEAPSLLHRNRINEGSRFEDVASGYQTQ